MKNYISGLNWALVYFVDRSTQDDHRSKLKVEALFQSPAQAEDNYIIRNPEHKRYLLHVDDLEKAEEVYNRLQDLRENYGEHAIFALDQLGLSTDEENKWRTIFEVYTSVDI